MMSSSITKVTLDALICGKFQRDFSFVEFGLKCPHEGTHTHTRTHPNVGIFFFAEPFFLCDSNFHRNTCVPYIFLDIAFIPFIAFSFKP